MDEKIVTVGARKLTLKNPGPRWYIRMQDECAENGNYLNEEKYRENLLNDVVVEDINTKNYSDDELDRLTSEILTYLGLKIVEGKDGDGKCLSVEECREN